VTVTGTDTTSQDADAVEVAALSAQVEFLEESLADAELAMEDRGWQKIIAGGAGEFSREGIRRAAGLGRLMAVQHPLVKRGLGIRQAYVWGQGVTVQARAKGDGGDQDVNAVVQAFWDDEGNQAAFTGDQVQEDLERALGTDGNVFLVCFTNPRTGFVQARKLPFDEITDVVSNPDDRDEPWYYRRQWTQRNIGPDGVLSNEERVGYYPALRYRPASRPKTVNGAEVFWDSPVHHVKVNGLDGWAFGIGDAYAALPWARAYKDFLGDWAVLVKSLSQYAWRATSKGGKAQQMRQALARRPTQGAPGADNPNSVGGTAVMSGDVTLEAIPKSGATIDSESGKPLAAMIAAALDVPVTVLLADPGQTGARAVAETLTVPTALAMMQRQSVWAHTIRSITGYAIKQAVRAPQGPLRGTFIRDPFTGREVVTLTGNTDPTVEVAFPRLDELPMETIISAVVQADGTQTIPKLEVARLLLNALGVKDVDEVLDEITDDDGNFIDQTIPAGQAVMDLFRRGQDPAEALR